MPTAPTEKKNPRNIRFHWHLAYFFVGLMLLFGLVSAWYFQSATESLLLIEARDRFETINKNAANHVRELYENAARTTALMAEQRLMRAGTLTQRLDSLPYLVTALRSQPSLAAAYIAYENGDFFMLSPWRNEADLQARFGAPAATAWMAQSIERSKDEKTAAYLFFDENLRLLQQTNKPEYFFDPRLRPWYQSAKASPGVKSSLPYVFFSTQKAGVSISAVSGNQLAVVGVDVRLETIATYLMQFKGTPDTRFLLLTAQQDVIASSKGLPDSIQSADGKLSLPNVTQFDGRVMGVLRDQYTQRKDKIFSFETAGDTWEAMIRTIPVTGGAALQFWAAAPHVELLAPALVIRNHSLVIAASLLLLGVALAMWLARMASRPLVQLNEEAQRIARFDFSQPIVVTARITEIVELATSMGTMKSTIEHFLELSQALAAETNFQRLLLRIVSDMRRLTQAQGGMIYLADAGEAQLELAHAQWGEHLPLEALQTLKRQSEQNHPIVQMLEQQQELRVLSAQQVASHFGFLKNFLTEMDGSAAAATTLLSLPLRNKNGELLGILVLLVPVTKALSVELLAFARALSATAAIALNTQRLVEEQKILMNAFIELLAGAIDAKSPYTGGHCQRVPVLTTMLADAACAAESGPYAGFSLNEDEREALRIACWLHDCGKITTPEYVVDKATKLETLYDRIHEVRIRFEVLKRDAQLASLQAQLAGGDADSLAQQLAAELHTLDEEFAFVALCNEGGEFMAEEKIARLSQIAQRTWMRTLDDNLGISHEEKARKQSGAQAPLKLPVAESLLSDKPEHLHSRAGRDQLGADNPWGFKMTVPELLYNRGELYNLSVMRGTLSEEERYKINEHIVQTIIMLEKLPFPRHLRQVPEIAGGHHEKMDGSGYPKRLKKDEMSPMARMMAIADIFEALTAVDRPYKKGKLLSEAIKIMGFMKKDQHIDAELFELFLSSGAYLEYAHKFMRAEQIDRVDLALYLPGHVSDSANQFPDSIPSEKVKAA
jgi:HD-GYP domain-containing protein (c-di-GMP phosphodiesterase class II)/HAMP domain-containing protein